MLFWILVASLNLYLQSIAKASMVVLIFLFVGYLSIRIYSFTVFTELIMANLNMKF